jgi:hypothetical protein
MLNFEKMSVHQVLVFSEVVIESSLLQREFVENKYLRSASNFTETFEFLQELSLVESKDGGIVLNAAYQEFLKDLSEARDRGEVARNFLIDHFVRSINCFSEYVDGFLSQFHLANGRYEFAPSVSERLKYSGLRNFLIDLEFLYLSETKYIIAENYSLAYAELREHYQLSPDEFLKMQDEKKEIGKTAEREVLEFEKERLSEFPELVKRIEYTALEDVSAGYDIKSYEAKLNKNGSAVARFIEVKAVCARDYRFNWTRNEIEKSKLYRQNYYLYLLPVIGNKKFDLKSLRVIRDPYPNIYEGRDEWTCTCEVLTFSLAEGSNR